MQIATTTASNKQSGQVDVADGIFGQAFNEGLVHQVVTAYLAAARQGSKAQKNRARVRGGGRKPWRQKGTGNARAGTIRSPLWRGGGVTFAAKPRSFKQKVNRKMFHGALRSIFSELVRQERLIVVKTFAVGEPKTKNLVKKLKGFDAQNVLLIVEELTDNLKLAVRNLPHAETCTVKQVNPISLVKHEKVIITESVLKQIEEWLQ